MSLKETNGTEPVKTRPMTCYHCGRMLWEDPRGHIGCLNTKCRRLPLGSKKIQPRTTKISKKIRNILYEEVETNININQYKWRNKKE